MPKRKREKRPLDQRPVNAHPSLPAASASAGDALFFNSAASRYVVLAILFVTAFCARLYRIEQPPLEFHAARQHRSALIARAYYYQTGVTVPEVKKRNALISKQRQGILEPPVTELLACLAYRIAGGEYLWIPRVLSSVFWLVGGVFLYLLAIRIAREDGALFSTAFYLLLPYSVPASRSFQPDPLMIMLLIISLFTVHRYYEAPSTRRLVIAGIASGSTIFIKPFAAFFVFAAFMSLGIHKYRVRRAFVNRRAIIFALLSVVPFLVFFCYGTFVKGFLWGQIKGTVVPHLLLQSFFWDGWLRMIEHVTGHLSVIAALIGTVLLSRGLGKTMLIGLLAGYVTFSLFCSYHTPTHDYYQLPFIPIVALAIAPLAALIMNRLARLSATWLYRSTVCAVLVLALVMHTHAAPWRRYTSDYRPLVAVWKEVGEAVNHSDKTLWLASDYGKPLQYHGELTGANWPWRGDLGKYSMLGHGRMTAEQRLQKMRNRMKAEFFIVLEANEFAAQKDLKELLSSRYPLLKHTRRYLVYDLRERLDGDEQ